LTRYCAATKGVSQFLSKTYQDTRKIIKQDSFAGDFATRPGVQLELPYNYRRMTGTCPALA
jgi:hypothetical protein